MKWNNGRERAVFERQQTVLRETYLASGMTEEQIRALYEFDLNLFNSKRREAEHTQRLDFEAFDDTDTNEGQNPLYEKFADKLSVEMDLTELSRYAWIEELNNEHLAKALKKLPESDLEILTSLAIDGLSQTEIALKNGVHKSNVSRRIDRIKKYLEKFL